MKIFHLHKDRKRIDSFLKNRQATMTSLLPRVKKICDDVRINGDSAVLKYTQAFDRQPVKDISGFRITDKQMQNAYGKIDRKLIRNLKSASANIEKFHLKQKRGRHSWHETNGGLVVGEKYSALRRVGVYAPGGTASYPSTVLMTVIPAKIAGVKEIIVASPGINASILVAAHMAGADSIFRIGGAQAIAAMAFGTGTIPKVDKIVGPGSNFVSLAKSVVQQETAVGIDMVAGPTETMILTDGKSKPEFTAADLLSQAEHGTDSFLVLVTRSEQFAKDVLDQIQTQMKNLKHAAVINKCLKNNAAIIIVERITEGIDLANEIAPEHLELQLTRPWVYVKKIENAGAIILGNYSPASLADYFAGTNHVLPTAGRAKFSSPLGVDDFIKRTNLIASNKAYINRYADIITGLAQCEGFDAHAQAVRMRTTKELSKNKFDSP